MTLLQLLPIIAYVGCVALILAVASGVPVRARLGWRVPAAVGLAFALVSTITVAQDGLLLFWANHTANLSGNQVWFDLLIAVSIAFYVLAPRARAMGMPLVPWGLAVVATASIALLPMLARLMWLEQRATR